MIATKDDELELLELQLEETQRRQLCSDYYNSSQTFPNRRRTKRSLMTLWGDRGLLDECQRVQVQVMLLKINHWDFNAFTFDRLTHGSNLATLCTHLLQDHGVMTRFRLDPLVVWKFFALVEEHYHTTNPYHNGVHATDVTQAMNCFVNERRLARYLTPLECLAALVSAACHDLDHPGRNEKFLIATSSHLAGMYNNSSVLENHHWRSAVSLLWQSGLAESLDPDDYTELEDMVRSLILATDISRQQEFLSQLRHYIDRDELDMRQARFRIFILQIAIKCADISNPCRTWNISRLWSYRACEEFFRQGDMERELELPVTPFCDRFNITVAKVQSGFYRFVASPLFEEWNRFCSSRLSTSMTNNLLSNQARWDLIIQQEALDVLQAASSSSASSAEGVETTTADSRRQSLEVSQVSHAPSRSEDDDSDPCTSYPYLPLDISETTASPKPSSPSTSSRRHSLPLSDSLSQLFSAMTNPEPYDVKPVNLVRNMERRKSAFVRQSELYPTSTGGAGGRFKRRLFRSPIPPLTAEAEQSGSSPEEESSGQSSTPHVTFHFGSTLSKVSSGNEDEEEEEEEVKKGDCGEERGCGTDDEEDDRSKMPKIEDKENSRSHDLGDLGRRRGSLPSDLLNLGKKQRGCGQVRMHRRKSGGPELFGGKRRGSGDAQRTYHPKPPSIDVLCELQSVLRLLSPSADILDEVRSLAGARRGSLPTELTPFAK